MRSFGSPSGRQWTAIIYELPPNVSVTATKQHLRAPSVLRFASEGVTLDLADYPANWSELTDDDLVGLLRRATTPSFSPTSISDSDSPRA
jgi:hypothetical protein